MPMTTLETVTCGTGRRVQTVNVEPIVHFARAFVPGMAVAAGIKDAPTPRQALLAFEI
ncbi:MAG: hypothetical protein INR62_01285 [Rhodospirillales bacterium]|nr:hypothetical protein [Acetobacter sp.]